LDNWTNLANNTYTELVDLSQENLDKQLSDDLPPDWVYIDKSTGKWSAINLNDLTTNYGYDALRTPWRIALDYIWFNSTESKNYLSKLHFLGDQWNKNNKIYATYAHDGGVVDNTESISMYGAAMGYFITSDQQNSKEIYEQKLLSTYNQIKNNPSYSLGYYDENWLWFGIAMYDNSLTNLSSNIGTNQ
jgi:endoglucanase